VFTDPVATNYGGTVTIGVAGGSAKSLPRTGTGKQDATYRLEEAGNIDIELVLSHENLDTKPRAVARVQRSALIADPLLTGQNRPAKCVVTISASWDPNMSTGEVQALYAQLLSFLTPVAFLRLLAGEV
jgi:hypothetical protein